MRIAPLTGLFGANSSGKTSLLQLLLMLKQTVESSDRFQPLNLGSERSPVELGTFRDLIFQHTPGGSISWKIDWKLPKPLKIVDPSADPGTVIDEIRNLEFSAKMSEDEREHVAVENFAYQFGSRKATYEKKDSKSASYTLKVQGPGKFPFKRKSGRAWTLPTPVKCYGFPDQVDNYFQNAGFLSDFQLAFENLFSQLYYLGPLREYPKRQYTWGGSQPSDMGPRGEKVIDAILSSRDRGELISRGKGKEKLTVEAYTAYWLQQLGLIHKFEVKPVTKASNLYQVHVQRTSQSSSVLITDVGFGISQILPVIVLCYYVPRGSTIILEQPEIHLHPSVQAGLADVFIDAIKVRNVQIIVESHSEYFLQRLIRRIAEAERLTKEDVSLYFCENNGGQSTLNPLDVDEYGNIQNWPKDFFGDGFGEIAATTIAAMKRKMATTS